MVVVSAYNVHTYVHCIPVTCSAVFVYVQYVLCVCVSRFVQFADSGYEADPEIDRIEQQVS